MAKSLQSTIVPFLLLMATLNYFVSSTSMEEACHPSGYLRSKVQHCYDIPDCCKLGKLYPQYRCSPPVTGNTPATMTLASFSQGGIDYDPSTCDDRYHTDDEFIVALSTGWYGNGSRCLKSIKISANGKSVVAKVVDECDSVNGCDAEHDYQQPCPNNVVDASDGVWKALGIPKSQIGVLNVTWSDE